MANEFERLFRAEYPRLVRALTLACGDRETAADAAQEAFLQAHRHWRRISVYTDRPAWLRRVAVNRLANRSRGRIRLQSFLDRTPAPKAAVDADLVPDRLDLQGAVNALPAQQRLVVALHYLLDLSIAEVAQTLDVAPATVRSHLHSARRALADDPSLSPRSNLT